MSVKDQIRLSAIKLAKEKGIIAVTIKDICDDTGVAEGSFQSFAGIRFRELMESLLAEDVPVYVEGAPIKCRAVSPILRRAHFYEIALNIAKHSGVDAVNFSSIAERVGMHPQSVIKSLGSIITLREEIKKQLNTGA